MEQCIPQMLFLRIFYIYQWKNIIIIDYFKYLQLFLMIVMMVIIIIVNSVPWIEGILHCQCET